MSNNKIENRGRKSAITPLIVRVVASMAKDRKTVEELMHVTGLSYPTINKVKVQLGLIKTKHRDRVAA